MASSGFWTIPEEIPKRNPVSILKEQASALSDATKGLLWGNAELTTYVDRFAVDLSIIAPSLDNYTYKVLTAMYDTNLYPVSIRFYANRRMDEERANNEQEFEDILKKLLATPEIQKVIAGLISQVGR